MSVGYALSIAANCGLKVPIVNREIRRTSGGGHSVITCFPTYARRIDGTTWRVTLAGMVVRPLPPSSRRRALGMAVLKRLLDLHAESEPSDLFARRADAFLFQRAAGHSVAVEVAGLKFSSGPTDRFGHFEAVFDIDASRIDACGGQPDASGCRWLDWRATERADPDDFSDTTATGVVQFVEPLGMSVVSDIDDTVKVSNVTSKRELLANTFLRDFRPVPGMSEALQRLAESGGAFHYVSASPWQLTPFLRSFFTAAGLPSGSLHLRLFRLKDSTPLGRLPSSKRAKKRTLERILADFPGRRFWLIGDSGEMDPEIYSAVARKHPQQVIGIVIRDIEVDETHLARRRFHRLARRLPAGFLRRFTDPADVAAALSEGSPVFRAE